MVRILPRRLCSLHHASEGNIHQKALSPESSNASDLFGKIVAANSFKAVMQFHRQMNEHLRLQPTTIATYFPCLKSKLRSWRAKSLWAILDERANHLYYNRGKCCANLRVLIVGAGPSGLRAAIECQMLGAKVIVLEKRARFSRNNVLHLWPFVIKDLKNLGAKVFYGKFCSGSIDHISIRQLQLILLKVALLLGVEIHENVTFEGLLDPTVDQSKKTGWRAKVSPVSHPVANFQFHVLIGAGGSKTSLPGFTRIEDRHKLAIAVTANFVNYRTAEEAKVPEISGVSYIFNQKFFREMKARTGVELENIVYYKDETHYFVMTATKNSLLQQRVLLNDHRETAQLLAPENLDRRMLMRYARQAARYATKGELPKLDFFANSENKSDVSLFDFTNMHRSDRSCHFVEKQGHRLLKLLVGDCLLEPFWPTGSGCARGFLSALDAAWTIRCWCLGMTHTEATRQQELCYNRLRESTAQNLNKDTDLYTLNPMSRYTNLNMGAVS